jgi:hypothetical protein
VTRGVSSAFGQRQGAVRYHDKFEGGNSEITAHLSDNADEVDNVWVGDFLHMLNFLEKGKPERARGLCSQLLDHDRVKLVAVGVRGELAFVYANTLSGGQRGGSEGGARSVPLSLCLAGSRADDRHSLSLYARSLSGN